MKCPFCSSFELKVVDKRDIDDSIRRRRECLDCNKRFTTYEKLEAIPLIIIKKDQKREHFDSDKLKKGLLKACEKRLISLEQINQMVEKIETDLRNHDTQEIKSEVIGEKVMGLLKKMDKVAYIRFASVYKDFDDVSSFENEVKNLKKRG